MQKALFPLFTLAIFLSSCSKGSPVITFDRERIELGPVKEGIEIPCSFAIKNDGSSTLTIYDVYASCGCTEPSLHKRALAPKQSTQLDVRIDTSMKQGKVTKTVNVSSNDPDRPIVALALAMDVENRHKGLSPAGRAKILTDEHCMSCHVQQGIGTFGKDLYEADCAMCHGQKAQGGVGPCLTNQQFKDPANTRRVRDVIAHGSKLHLSMPGFEVTSGGPLSAKQVDSLVSYLAMLAQSKQ